MKRLALLPLTAVLLAACTDTATSPTAAVERPRLAIATTISAANAPTGTHFQAGTSATCSVSGLTVSCSSYQLAGVGNANASAALAAAYAAIVDCRNHGKQVVEVKAQAKSATVSTGLLEPKNGRLLVPALSTAGQVPSAAQFTASAVCPNGNWTKELRGGTITLSSFTYTLTFAGFSAPYIRITGP